VTNDNFQIAINLITQTFQRYLLTKKLYLCLEWQCQHQINIAGQSIRPPDGRLPRASARSVGFNQTYANKFMKVANGIPNVATLQHLGTSALYLIATLPEEEKQAQFERIEQGDRTFGRI